MQQLNHIPTLKDIQKTHQSIRPYIHHTPVLTSTAINKIAGADLFFKCENFQKIGAFKMRGGISAALRLNKKQQQKGLTTHSSGNHAQAVARAAQILGVPAYIVMPETSPSIKKKATASYGATITFCENTIEARQSTLEQVQAKTGATFIHPFNDYNVIVGQATCAKELIAEVNGLDAIIAPVGGGGLMSGTAIATHYLSTYTKIYGAEPSIVDDAFRAFHSGKIEKNERIDTIADGLRTNLGDKTYGIIKRYLDDIFTVNDEEIIAAMRLIWERMKIVIEPSCAVPLAAILKHPKVFAKQKIGVILTGGNVDLELLPF